MGPPDGFGRLNNEGREAWLKPIGMGLKPAVLGLFKGEGEGLEGLLGAKPDKAALAGVNVRLKDIAVATTNTAIEAIAGNDEVGLVLGNGDLVVVDLTTKDQVHTGGATVVLQNVEEPLAPDAAETMARRTYRAAFKKNLNIVPVIKRLQNLLSGVGVGGAQIGECLVREDHPPAKGVVGLVALQHSHGEGGVAFFEQQGGIEACGPSANRQDARQSWWGRGMHA